MIQESSSERRSAEDSDLTSSPLTQSQLIEGVSSEADDRACQADPSPDLTSEPPPAKSVQLRFQNTRKMAVPDRYLGLHTVLDRLGASEDSATWGAQPAWHLMPFLARGSERFCQPYIVRQQGKAKLKYKRVGSSATIEDLRDCAQRYQRVWRKLSGALQAGELNAYALRPRTGEINQITARGVWATQRIKIFYTGVLPIAADGRDELCRVVVTEKDFSDWMETLAKNQRSNASWATLDRIRACLDNFAEQGDYRLSREPTLTLVIATLSAEGLSLSKTTFSSRVWGQLKFKQTAGKPLGKSTDAFERDKPQIMLAIRDIVKT